MIRFLTVLVVILLSCNDISQSGLMAEPKNTIKESISLMIHKIDSIEFISDSLLTDDVKLIKQVFINEIDSISKLDSNLIGKNYYARLLRETESKLKNIKKRAIKIDKENERLENENRIMEESLRESKKIVRKLKKEIVATGNVVRIANLVVKPYKTNFLGKKIEVYRAEKIHFFKLNFVIKSIDNKDRTDLEIFIKIKSQKGREERFVSDFVPYKGERLDVEFYFPVDDFILNAGERVLEVSIKGQSSETYTLKLI